MRFFFFFFLHFTQFCQLYLGIIKQRLSYGQQSRAIYFKYDLGTTIHDLTIADIILASSLVDYLDLENDITCHATQSNFAKSFILFY